MVDPPKMATSWTFSAVLDAAPGVEDWRSVRFLIGELQRGEHLAAVVHQWDLAVRLFRKIERQQCFEREPTETDIRIHEALLHLLIGLGQELEFQTEKISDQDLAAFGFTKTNLLAYVQELKETFFLWHGPELAPRRKIEIEQAIFG